MTLATVTYVSEFGSTQETQTRGKVFPFNTSESFPVLGLQDFCLKATSSVEANSLFVFRYRKTQSIEGLVTFFFPSA